MSGRPQVHVSRRGSIDINMRGGAPEPYTSSEAEFSRQTMPMSARAAAAVGANSDRDVKDLQDELNEVIAELAQGSLNSDLASRLKTTAAAGAYGGGGTAAASTMMRSVAASSTVTPRPSAARRAPTSAATSLVTHSPQPLRSSSYGGKALTKYGESADGGRDMILRRRLEEKSRVEAELMKRVQVDKVRLLSLEDQLQEEAEGQKRAQRLYDEERSNAAALRERVAQAERGTREQTKLVQRLQSDLVQMTASVADTSESEARTEARARELEDELRALRHEFVAMQVKNSEAEQKISLSEADRAARDEEIRAKDKTLIALRSESRSEAAQLRLQLTNDAEAGSRATTLLQESERTVLALRARLRANQEDAATERRALELKLREASSSASSLSIERDSRLAGEQDALSAAARYEQQCAAQAQRLQEQSAELNALSRSHAQFESQAMVRSRVLHFFCLLNIL